FLAATALPRRKPGLFFARRTRDSFFGLAPAELEALLKSEIDKWSAIIKSVGSISIRPGTGFLPSTHQPGGLSVKTVLCDLLGIEIPIIQAPMAGAVGPALVAAVSNAGGLGMLVPWRADIDAVRRQIRETRDLTSKPFGVNLNLEFPQEER